VKSLSPETVAIPNWNADGLLPPIQASQPVGASRSPYPVSLLEVVQRYGSTTARRQILQGLLRYRQALQQIGLAHGFQWLDGSFCEHVESIENRAPRDIDVVTFYRLPVGSTQADLVRVNPDLFRQQQTKQEYAVDGYLVDLGSPAESLVASASYWYGVWSHRRDQRWKGFLQVELADPTEAAAREWIARSGDHP
jgi:hypothetical protein